MSLIDEQLAIDMEDDWEPMDRTHVRCAACYGFTLLTHEESKAMAPGPRYCPLCEAGEEGFSSDSDGDSTLPWPQPVRCPVCLDERIIPAYQSHPITPSGQVVMDHCEACTAAIGRGEAAIDDQEDSSQEDSSQEDSSQDKKDDDPSYTSDWSDVEGEDSNICPQDEEDKDYVFEL